MSRILAQEKIESSYTYLGQIPRSSDVDLNKIVNEKSDNYLIFSPRDTSSINFNQQNIVINVPHHDIGIKGRALQQKYKEEFYVDLYAVNKNLPEKIWSRILKVDIDYSQTNKYKKMAGSIVDKIISK